MPLGVNYSETEYRMAVAIAEVLSGTNVGEELSSGGNSTVTINNLPALNAGRLPIYRQDRSLTQIFTLAIGATQTDWFTINSDSKLLLLEVPAMTGTILQVRWRHPITTGTSNPVVDAFGAPISLTIGATSRTFSSDALAPLARCVLGDGEISFVSNVAEGAQRLIKLYY